jgi:predicted HAD superfamily Cof-like phosphohydrolase
MSRTWTEIEADVFAAAGELVAKFRDPNAYRASHEEHPTAEEVDTLDEAVRSGVYCRLVAETLVLCRKYQDGYTDSCRLSHLAYRMDVANPTAFRGGPNKNLVARVPAVAEVLYVMNRSGCSQKEAVELLGGNV